MSMKDIVAEVEYDNQHGPIVKIIINGISVAIFLLQETGVVTTAENRQYGIEVAGLWPKFKSACALFASDQIEAEEKRREELMGEPVAYIGRTNSRGEYFVLNYKCRPYGIYEEFPVFRLPPSQDTQAIVDAAREDYLSKIKSFTGECAGLTPLKSWPSDPRDAIALFGSLLERFLRTSIGKPLNTEGQEER